jgi:hypothetical protein
VGPGWIGRTDVQAVVAHLREDARHDLIVKPGPIQADAWRSVLARPPAQRHSVHMLDLEGGFETVWTERFGTRMRQRVRHAQRVGVTVEHATGVRHIETFHSLYAHWCDNTAHRRHRPQRLQGRLGERREPPHRADVIARRLGDACHTVVATLNGEPIGVVIVLVLGRVAWAWRYAYDRERAGHTYATDLLHSAAIEDACAAGCTTYHLGESGGVEAIASFKDRLGASPVEYPEFHLRAGDRPAPGA